MPRHEINTITKQFVFVCHVAPSLINIFNLLNGGFKSTVEGKLHIIFSHKFNKKIYCEYK